MADKKYIKYEPYVDDKAIHIPVVPWAAEGGIVAYKTLITKDLFVEAYNKWIKNATVQPSGVYDSVDRRNGVYDCSTCNRHDASGNSKSVECMSCTTIKGGIPSHWVGKW